MSWRWEAPGNDKTNRLSVLRAQGRETENKQQNELRPSGGDERAGENTAAVRVVRSE